MILNIFEESLKYAHSKIGELSKRIAELEYAIAHSSDRAMLDAYVKIQDVTDEIKKKMTP